MTTADQPTPAAALPYRATPGPTIQNARAALGLTQQELATQLGVDRSAVSLMERCLLERTLYVLGHALAAKVRDSLAVGSLDSRAATALTDVQAVSR